MDKTKEGNDEPENRGYRVAKCCSVLTLLFILRHSLERSSPSTVHLRTAGGASGPPYKYQ